MTTGWPSATELLDAVREFLERDVMDATEGRVRFHARVAANVVAIVERELELADRHRVARQARWAGLGVAGDGELAHRIRAGEFDQRWDEVVAAVRAEVAERLEIDHPGYATGD